MKKILFFFFAFTTCLVFISCGDDEDGDDNVAPSYTAEAEPVDEGNADFMAKTKDGKYLYFVITTPKTCMVVHKGYSRSHNLKLEEKYANYVQGAVTIPSKIKIDSDTYDVTAIDDDALFMTKITNLKVPKSIATIGIRAFAESYFITLNSDISGECNWPDWIDRIPDAACSCANFKQLNIPNNVKSIGIDAFQSCDNLEDLHIPDGVIVIKDAFNKCDALESVYIPHSVKEIDCNVFHECLKLNSITYDGTIDQWKSILVNGEYLHNRFSTIVVHCNDGDTK